MDGKYIPTQISKMKNAAISVGRFATPNVAAEMAAAATYSIAAKDIST